MKYAIFGAGGYSREVADLVAADGHEVTGFCDDHFVGVHDPTGLPIVCDWRRFDAEALTIAIGDPLCRARVYKSTHGQIILRSLLDPSACVKHTSEYLARFRR